MQSRIKFYVYMKFDPMRDRKSRRLRVGGGGVNKCKDQRRPTKANCDRGLVIDKF